MSRKIISISSASDWWVGYGDPTLSEQQYFNRVVAFALCEDSEGQQIAAVDTLDFEEGIGSTASEAENYRGLFHSSDFKKLGEEQLPGAQARFLKGA